MLIKKSLKIFFLFTLLFFLMSIMFIYAASVSLVPTSDGITSAQNVSTGLVTEFTYTITSSAQISAASYPLINNTQVTAAYINTAGSTSADVYVLWNVTLPVYTSINSIYLTARVAPATVFTGGLQIVLWNYSSPSWNLTNWTTNGGVATNRTLNYNLSTAGRISNFVNGRNMKFMVRTNGTTATDIAVDYMEVNVSYEVAASSCTYTSGNWDINCVDACVISSNVAGTDKTKYNLTFSGLGQVFINANISNFLYYYIYGNTGCNVTCERGNCIQV